VCCVTIHHRYTRPTFDQPLYYRIQSGSVMVTRTIGAPILGVRSGFNGPNPLALPAASWL
ncbi:MAG: hypothetical protein K2O84_08935, partial [Oscillospiraceae bacterium]|nr:hypothetical protein [Oscillospiraceae bacterium]